jgi:hypothetical protein
MIVRSILDFGGMRWDATVGWDSDDPDSDFDDFDIDEPVLDHLDANEISEEAAMAINGRLLLGPRYICDVKGCIVSCLGRPFSSTESLRFHQTVHGTQWVQFFGTQTACTTPCHREHGH